MKRPTDQHDRGSVTTALCSDDHHCRYHWNCHFVLPGVFLLVFVVVCVVVLAVAVVQLDRNDDCFVMNASPPRHGGTGLWTMSSSSPP